MKVMGDHATLTRWGGSCSWNGLVIILSEGSWFESNQDSKRDRRLTAPLVEPRGDYRFPNGR